MNPTDTSLSDPATEDPLNNIEVFFNLFKEFWLKIFLNFLEWYFSAEYMTNDWLFGFSGKTSTTSSAIWYLLIWW